jgi:hypothetical protein
MSTASLNALEGVHLTACSGRDVLDSAKNELKGEKLDEESWKRSLERRLLPEGFRHRDNPVEHSCFSVQHPICISKASSAHSMSESLHDLLDKNATSAELRALHHEGVQRFFSIGAYISYALEVDDEFTASNVICIVLACDLSQLVGPRRNDLTL